jgi:hypothetical protein
MSLVNAWTCLRIFLVCSPILRAALFSRVEAWGAFLIGNDGGNPISNAPVSDEMLYVRLDILIWSSRLQAAPYVSGVAS